MPTTGKVTSKRYQCSNCGHQLTANTNHYGDFYDRCPKCSWKSPQDPVKTFACLEQLPKGWTKPEPWTKVSLEVVLNGHPVKE